MDIRIPEVGESVQEALLAKWLKNNGDLVKKDEPLCEIETDKITLDINADAAGTLEIRVTEGTTVKIGTVIGTITELSQTEFTSPVAAELISAPVSREEEIRATVSSPSIRRGMREQDIAPDTVSGTGKGGRITLDDLFSRIEGSARRMPSEPDEDIKPVPVQSVSIASASRETPLLGESPVIEAVSKSEAASVNSEAPPSYEVRRDERRPMSPIRKRISERLVAVRQQTAMLTTFNEVDMMHVANVRSKYREHFKSLYGIPLGLMPFFVKASIAALSEYPTVNASIDGADFVFHNYYDIGIAIGAEKGLVVPVLRNADKLKCHEIDQAILDYKKKIDTNRIAISELTGGTFTISNGGIYGSMLSTPILNSPQSAVLGMHAIQDRPVVREGLVVIRPMMYLALSYDHRIIDGREAVGFLKRIKDYLETLDEFEVEG